MQYDVDGARRAGLSDEAIANYLSEHYGYDADAARKAGFSNERIIDYVSKQGALRSEMAATRDEGRDIDDRLAMYEAYESDPDVPALMRSELGRQVAKGFANVGSGLLGFGAQLTPGAVSEQLMRGSRALRDSGDIPVAAAQSIGEIESLGDLAGFAGATMAQQVPNLLMSGAAAGGLRLAGVSPELAARVAPAITTLPQTSGSIYSDIVDQTGETGLAQRAAALGGGAIAAGLEAFGGESRALKNLMQPGAGASARRIVGRAVSEGLKAGGQEALTEAGQEIVEAVTPAAAGGRMPSLQELMERAGTGALGGLFVGGAMGGGSRLVGDAAELASADQRAVDAYGDMGRRAVDLNLQGANRILVGGVRGPARAIGEFDAEAGLREAEAGDATSPVDEAILSGRLQRTEEPPAGADAPLSVDGISGYGVMLGQSENENRVFVTVPVNGVPMLFYKSSKGTSGKKAGSWYPAFGIGAGDWIVKGSVKSMESGYGVPEIKEAMDRLNRQLPGDPESTQSTLAAALGKPAGARQIAIATYGAPGFNRSIGVNEEGQIDNFTGASQRIRDVISAVVAGRSAAATQGQQEAPKASAQEDLVQLALELSKRTGVVSRNRIMRELRVPYAVADGVAAEIEAAGLAAVNDEGVLTLLPQGATAATAAAAPATPPAEASTEAGEPSRPQAARLIKPARKRKARIAATSTAPSQDVPETNFGNMPQVVEPEQAAGPSAADLARGVLGRSGFQSPSWPQQPEAPRPNPSAMDLARGMLSRSGFSDAPAAPASGVESAAAAPQPNPSATDIARAMLSRSGFPSPAQPAQPATAAAPAAATAQQPTAQTAPAQARPAAAAATPSAVAPVQSATPAAAAPPAAIPPKKKAFKPKKTKSTLLSAEEEAEVEKALATIKSLTDSSGKTLGVSGGGDAMLVQQLAIIALQYIKASARKAKRLFADYVARVKADERTQDSTMRQIILGWNVYAARQEGDAAVVGAVPEIGSIARLRSEALKLATSPKNAKVYGVVMRYEEDGTAYVALTNMSAKAMKAVGYRGGEVIQVPIDAVIDERAEYDPEFEAEDAKELEVEGETDLRRSRVLAAAKEAERIPVYNTLLALSEKALFGESASEAEKPVEVTPYVREFAELTQKVVSPGATKEDIAKWNASLASYAPAQAWSIIGNVLGPTARTAIEATYYIADAARFVSAGSRRESVVGDVALDSYIDRVINWAHKNMFGPKGPVWTRFAPATALKNATLDAGRKQRRRLSRETSLEGEQLKFGDAVQSSAAADTASTGQMANEGNDTGLPDQGPAEDPTIALFDVIAVLDRIGGFDVGNEVDERLVANTRRAASAKKIRELVAEEVRQQEVRLGRELEFTELKEAISNTIRVLLPKQGVTAALVESTSKSSESGLIELNDAISRASRKIAYALFNVYQSQGSDGIRYDDRLFSGPAALASDSAVVLGEGSYSIADAVRTVSANATKGSLAERIASRLVQLAGGGRVTVLSDADWQRLGRTDGEYAYYDVNTGDIFVRQTAAAHDYLVMHEVVHALTVNRIKSDPEFRRFILSLRKEAIGRVPGNWYGLQEHGADWRNAAEFVGEALSSTAFQEELQKLPAGKKTIWQSIKDAIGKLIGIGGKDAQTMLDVIMDAALVKQQGADDGSASTASDAAYMALAGRASPDAKSPSREPLSDALISEFAETDSSGAVELKPELLLDLISSGRLRLGPVRAALLSHLLRPDSRHKLSTIELVRSTEFAGRFIIRHASNVGSIQISTIHRDGSPLSVNHFAHVLSHELIHNAVTSKLDESPEFKRRAESLYNYVMEKSAGTKWASSYAMSSVSEFFAEGIASSEFRKFLLGIDYPATIRAAGIPSSGRMSAFGGMLHLLKQALNLPKFIYDTFTGERVDAITALDELVDVAHRLESQNRIGKHALMGWMEQSNPQSDSILFAAPTWGSRKQVRETVTGPGLTEPQVNRIEMLAGIMAGVVPQSVSGVIGQTSKKAQARLKWISRIGKLADAEEQQVGEVEGTEGDLIPEYDAVPGDEAAMGPQRIADLEQQVRNLAAAGNTAAADELTSILEEGSVSASNIVDRIKRMRDSQVVRLQKRMEEVERTREKVLEKIRKGERRADFISAAADDMVDQYEEYVDDLSKTKVGPDARADAVIADAAQKVKQTRASMEEVEKALRAIVDNVPPGLVEQAAAAKSPQVIVDWVRSSGVLASSGVKPAVIAQLLDGDGALLPRYASLHKMIETVKAYESKAASIETDIASFEKEWADIWANTKLWVYDPSSKTWVKRMVTRKTKDGSKVEEEAPDPDAKRVEVDVWAKKYASMVAKLTRQMDAVRLLSREIAKQDADILTTIEVIRALDQITADHELNRQYEGAVRVINLLSEDYRGQDDANGNIIFRVGGKSFVVRNSMEKQANEEANATVQEIRGAIAEELEKGVDPFERNRLEKMLARLSQFGQTMSDAALSIGFFDVLTHFRRWFPLTRTQMTRDLLYRLIPSRIGGELRTIAQLIDSSSVALRAITDHQSYGFLAMDRANARAARSHPGMDPVVWNREVLNSLLAGNQELKRYNLKVGDVIPAFGHKITKEDMEAARLQAKFSDAVYRVMRGMGQAGIRMHFPVLVQDRNGKLRYPYASGALTVPRRLQSAGGPGTLRSLASEWIEIGSDLGGKLAKLSEDGFFRNFALAHVSELNPEYERKELFSPVSKEPYAKPSTREAAYQKLAFEWSTGRRSIPGNIDDLVSQIAEVSQQSRSDVREGLVREIDSLARDYVLELEYRTQIDMNTGKQVAAFGSEAAPKKIGRLIDPDNNFTQARGRMVAPSTFYDYTASSDIGRGSLIAGATLQPRTRQLELLDTLVSAIEQETTRLKDSIAKADKSGLGRQARRGISADVSSGRLYADLSELRRLSIILNEIKSNLEASMQKVSQAVSGKTLFEEFIDVQRVLLVAQLTAATTNFMSAVSAGQWVPRMALSRLSGSLSKGSALTLPVRLPVALFKTAAKAAFDLGSFALYKFKPARRWLLANRGKLVAGLEQIARSVKAMQDADENLRRLGVITDPMKLRERARIISEIGTFSNPVPASESELPGLSEKIRRLFSKPLLAHGVEFLWNVPSSMDRLSNVINAVNAELEIKRSLGNAAMIIDNRAAAAGGNPDGSLYNADWANPANAFTEAEAAAVGVTLESLIAMKQEFGVVGGLERLAHDYWRRIQQAKARGENVDDVPPIADPGIAGDLVIRLLAMTNLPTDSNSPDVIKGNTVAGRIINSFIAFPRWINSWVSTLGLLQATAPTGKLHRRAITSALATMAVFAMLAISGVWLNELKAIVYRLWNGREYPVLTMTNVVNDPSPANVVRLLGAAIALNVPYAGEGIANLAGATQYRSSATDISSLSLPISMVNRVYDGVMSIAKLGDVAGGAGQIVRSLVPGSGAVINRMMPGRAEISDAQRAAVAARGSLEARESGGRGGQPTEFSSLVRRAVAAEVEGDKAEADQLIRRAVALKAQDSDDPWGAVRSAVQASSPSIRAFGRRITDSEEQGLLGRMTGSQRRAYTNASGAVDSLLQRVGAAGRTARGSDPVSRSGPAARLMRTPPTSVAISRIRAARSKAMPKALKEARAKLRQAKIRIPRISGSGSGGRGLPRLVRPAQARSALRPLRSPTGA